ncbi:MAG: phosphatase PAP2 family protein [Peptostreptococcaceae bacterium]|nr:phosphatase PAP2 family protein [Peptostreptococcaceae bacterium]
MQAMEFAILDQLQKIHHPILDKLMIYASRSSDHGEIWAVIALFLLVFYLQKTKKRKRYVELYRMGNVEKHAAASERSSMLNPGVTILLAMLFSVLIVNLGLKPLVMRIRPYDINTAAQLITGHMMDYSFPSGHSSVSFAAATAILSWNKKAGVLAILLASIIAFSRLYLYLHYPTDVLAGIMIGILCGIMAYLLQKRSMKRF